ncbi:MAG: CopG family antitoxin, partial [Capsulimonadaceae bacterium]
IDPRCTPLSTVSSAENYEAIGAFWDNRDLADHWEQTEPAQFDVDIHSQVTYFAVEGGLSERLRTNAARQGIAAETLLNRWLQERINQEASAP